MQMVNATKEPNSATGNGLISTAFRGLKELFLSLGGKKSDPPTVEIATLLDGFWVVDHRGYGVTWSGPYKREQDAKGVRTRLLKQSNRIA